MKRDLLQRAEGGEEVSGEEAELVIMKEESPEGGQVTEGRREETRTSSEEEKGNKNIER